MNRSPGSLGSTPVRDSEAPASSASELGDEEVWFEVHARDGLLTGTSSRVVHRRTETTGRWTVQEWRYGDLRSLHVIDGRDGGSIVIEPLRGPLVPIPIEPADREAAFQAATVFELLIARAQRQAPIRPSFRR
jgi:hypothetical protein